MPLENYQLMLPMTWLNSSMTGFNKGLIYLVTAIANNPILKQQTPVAMSPLSEEDDSDVDSHGNIKDLIDYQSDIPDDEANINH